MIKKKYNKFILKPILIIAYYFPPSGGPAVQRTLKFVKYLSKLGYSPIVLTVDEKYASYPILDKKLYNEIPKEVKIYKTKTREVLSFYKKINGNQLPKPSFSDDQNIGLVKKIIRFIRGNFFIPDPRKGWNKYCYAKAKKLIQKYNINTVFVTTPPHSTQMVGVKLKHKLGIKYIADFRDPWLGAYYTQGMYKTAIAKWIEKRYESKVLKTADEVILVSAKDILEQKIKDKKKVHFIPNGFDLEDFTENLNPKKHPNTFWISYFGSIAAVQPVDNFIKAFAKFCIQNKNIDIQLNFTGSINSDVQKKCRENNILDRVNFHKYLTHKEALKMMKQAHILYMILPKIKNYQNHLAGKLFEYIATKNPILCIGNKKGIASQIITECNTGKCFDYDQIEGVVSFLNEKLNLWKQDKNIQYCKNEHLQYSRENLTKQLIKVIENDIRTQYRINPKTI